MDPNYVFTARLDDVSSMSKVLHELHQADDHSVLVISQYGIRLITAGEKTFQVSAYFAASTFQEYSLNTENLERVNFRFMLRDFIETLNLLRNDPISEGDRIQLEGDDSRGDLMTTSLQIEYRRKSGPLRLKLENKSNYVINCDLKAFNLPSDSMFRPLTFSDSEELAIVLLDSKRFYDYVSGLDLVQSEYVNLTMSRGQTPIKMSTCSTLLGEVELEIPHNETEIIKREIIVSDNCVFSFSYKAQFMKPALEALRNSKFMQMKCGSSGLLCIEHFHPCDKKKRDGPFLRPDNTYMTTQTTLADILTEQNVPESKRSSVEYFILSEVRPVEYSE